MDFTSFLKIKPDVESAIAQVSKEVQQAQEQLLLAKAIYDALTTQAENLRLVLDMLNGITSNSAAASMPSMTGN